MTTTAYKPAIFPLYAMHGVDFVLDITHRDGASEIIDTTNYKAVLEAVSSFDSDTQAIRITSQGPSPKIVMGGANGKILLTVPKSEVSLWPPGEYQYNYILQAPSGPVFPYMMGLFVVQRSAIRTGINW